MLANYFKIGFRILIRQRSYTVLNIVGLAIGIAVFVFIYLYIQSEIRYDRHWTDHDRIYRVWYELSLDGKVEKVALTPYLLDKEIRNQFPEVEASTKLYFNDPSDANDMSSITYEGEIFEIPDITLGTEELFNIFDYHFLEGNPDTALKFPNTMVISSEVALQIFGNESPIGKKLNTVVREYTITGVFDKTGCPSHLNFDAVVSEASLSEEARMKSSEDWLRLSVYTYIKLADTVDPQAFEKRLNNYTGKKIENYIEESKVDIDGQAIFRLEPLSDVHFNTSLGYDSPSNADFNYLLIFGIIAAFILLTASINYINLAMARSLKRAREVGVRKVLGAQRKQLIFQHISESFIVTTIAFLLALSLVELLMPQFNILVGRELTLVGTLFTREGIVFGILLVLMIILLAVISGLFPAFILASFQTVNVLRGKNFFLNFRGKQHISAGGLRKVLVTIQYMVSIGMIIATSIIFAQMHFVKNRHLGFDHQNILVINTPKDTSFYHRKEDFLNELRKSKGINDVSITSNVPAYTFGKMMFSQGYDTVGKRLQALGFYSVDYDFFKVLGIPLVEGQFFDKENEDSLRHFIINEAAASFLGLKDPVGQPLVTSAFREQGGKIIGVVRDFHFYSLHKEVEPLVFMISKWENRYILVNIDETKTDLALADIERTWNSFNPGYYMHYTYLTDKISSLYQLDQKMLSIFIYFSIFVIFISSLGLYGLSSFLIEQRTKEIGVRKVLGGSNRQITLLLAKDFLILVFLAGLIASPIVYYLMSNWLETFAFQIHITGWYFVFGILLAMLFALCTVLIRSYYVVKQSPAAALKYE